MYLSLKTGLTGKRISNLLYLILYISIIISLGSCKTSDKIKIGDIQKVEMAGMAGSSIFLDVTLPIENSSNTTFRIVNMFLKLKANGEYIGDITNTKDIKILKHSELVYTIRLKLKIEGLFGIFNAAKLLNGKNVYMEFSGEVKAKALGMTKRIEINEAKQINLSDEK